MRHSAPYLPVAMCMAIIGFPLNGWAQTVPNSSLRRASEKGVTVERAIELAAKGQCGDALPVLQKSAANLKNKDMKYKALMATLRCALQNQDDRTASDTLFNLKQDFPEDPEVLYKTSQFFLSLAETASQELTTVAPDSYQTRELQAESLESQGKWAEATEIYKTILEEHPQLRGIHYRLARAALAQPESPTSTEDAKREFQQELAIDPVNAAAEFWLGEIAKRDGAWDDAVLHFGTAAKLDPKFRDALLSLGTSLNAAGRYAEAIPPIEQYLKNDPGSVAGHYQLSIAYLKTGRKADAEREMALHQQALEKSRATANARSTSPQP